MRLRSYLNQRDSASEDGHAVNTFHLEFLALDIQKRAAPQHRMELVTFDFVSLHLYCTLKFILQKSSTLQTHEARERESERHRCTPGERGATTDCLWGGVRAHALQLRARPPACAAQPTRTILSVAKKEQVGARTSYLRHREDDE